MLRKSINALILALTVTNPVNAGFDDVWRERVAREPDETGVASIYSDAKVSTGERFDAKALTCAHKTRPLCTVAQDAAGICPSRSYITVRLGSTGKAVRCRVNDRGPFIGGRVIDLTGGAAAALGLSWKEGIARVTLD